MLHHPNKMHIEEEKGEIFNMVVETDYKKEALTANETDKGANDEANDITDWKKPTYELKN